MHLAPWLRWLLAPAGLLYRGGVALRNALYRRRLLEARHVPVPVISVGNLDAGGSGKTSFVAYLAGRLREAGRRVAVASRGYGGRRHDAPVTVSDGKGPLSGVGEVGDEPVFLASLLPSAVVVVCRDRSAAALFALERYGSDLVILDDGFQHRRIHRDLDLVLVDAVEGLGNGKMMPFGPLREPMEELRRADALVITGAARDLRGGAERIRELIRRLGLTIPVFVCERRADGFLRVDTEEPVPPAALKGMKVLAFSGIARPRSFEEDLRSLGLNLVESIRFRDHQAFGAPQVERVRTAARRSEAELIVTTEKDLTRLGTVRFPVPLYTLRIRMVPRDEDGLWDFVSSRLSLPGGAPRDADD
jgi:tetraacyldisaccharide 4'-kinase